MGQALADDVFTEARAAGAIGQRGRCGFAAATGVPIAAGGLGGMDALLSTVQMPTGIPVATVAVDSAANAAYLAASILSLGDGAVAAALSAYRSSLAE